MFIRRFVLCSFLLSSSGCGLIERAACGEPCEGGSIPVEGVPADFTLAGRDDEAASISEPRACEEEEDVFVTTIEARGDDDEVDTGMWIFDRLVPELQQRGLGVSRGLGRCAHVDGDDALGFRLGTHDWGDMDAIVQTVLDVAAEDDVAVRVVVAAEPEPIYCADVGCGI
ncbi:MAG: hypothetical protein AAGA54_24875 [Myxococcota bacterium]